MTDSRHAEHHLQPFLGHGPDQAVKPRISEAHMAPQGAAVLQLRAQEVWPDAHGPPVLKLARQVPVDLRVYRVRRPLIDHELIRVQIPVGQVKG